MTPRERKVQRAIKIFELFVSDDDNESVAAYDRLCEIGGIKLTDVAAHLFGNFWKTLNAGIVFELTDDIPLLHD